MTDLMTPEEVAEMMKVERRTFVRTISKAPGFPAPVRLGARIVRWPRQKIETWLQRQERMAA